MIQVVKVDWSSKDVTGEDYSVHAVPEAVVRGFMINVPTLIQYPNGKIKTGNQVKVTPAGLDYLKRQMPVEMRAPEGQA
ncbi:MULTISPECIES: hypothetical protein [Rhizobium]|uniref:hypothetical protein n=1 Tax=Rhizobium TaxID=379 RepID=UPI00140BB8DB|nr:MULTISPECIES: hypothetical protein [Rhizobium]MDG3578358.1 hypothetical protein [Rhizobium sp. YJ-22]